MAMPIEELRNLGTYELVDVYERALFDNDEETAKVARGHLYSEWTGRLDSLSHGALTKCISKYGDVTELSITVPRFRP